MTSVAIIEVRTTFFQTHTSIVAVAIIEVRATFFQAHTSLTTVAIIEVRATFFQPHTSITAFAVNDVRATFFKLILQIQQHAIIVRICIRILATFYHHNFICIYINCHSKYYYNNLL